MSKPITQFFAKAASTKSAQAAKAAVDVDAAGGCATAPAAGGAALGAGGTKRCLSTTAEGSEEPLQAAKRTKPVAGGSGSALQLEPGWQARLGDEASKPYFKKLHKFLEGEARANKVIFPPKAQVMTAFDLCPFDRVKVVILGQDPYHGPGQAHGLAFSVLDGVQLPPSLRNIYKELGTDLKLTMPKADGNLTKWAKQGVLLLNTCLTVRKSEANSHRNQGWEQFTDQVIKSLNKEKEGLVFLLWGKPAQTKCSIVNKSKHHIITSSHPSPLSATKTNEPFIGSRCFSRTNELLVQSGKDPIDWSI